MPIAYCAGWWGGGQVKGGRGAMRDLGNDLVKCNGQCEALNKFAKEWGTHFNELRLLRFWTDFGSLSRDYIVFFCLNLSLTSVMHAFSGENARLELIV